MRSTMLAGSLLISATLTLAQSSNVAATGYLTDTHCGRRGATSLHLDCAKHNVAAGRAQYAIYDEASKKLYILPTPDEASRQQVEQLLGQRVRITGTLAATPITRAGQTLAPDAVAVPNPRDDAAGHADQSAAARTVTGDPLARSGPLSASLKASVRVHNHPKALDTTTPVAGALSIC